MIKKIGIENFRIFRELTEFEIAPITVLTGTNNSGKSSFLKMMNLLQQSVKDLNSLNVLNFENGNHNLGSFENTISWDSDKKDITIVFDFPLDYFDEDFKLELVYRKMGEVGFIKSYKVFNENRVLLSLDDIKFESDSNYKSFINTESIYDYYFSFDLEYIKKTIFEQKIKNGTISSDLMGKPEDFLFYTYLFNDEKDKINLNETIKNKKGDFKNLREDLLMIESSVFAIRPSIDNYPIKNMNRDLFTESFNGTDEPLYFWKKNSNLGKYLSKLFKNDLLKNEGEDNVFDDLVSIEIDSDNLYFFKKIVVNNIQNTLDKLKYSMKNIDFLSAQRGNSDGEIKSIAKLFYSLQSDINNRFLIESLELLKIKGELIVERVLGRFTTVSLLQNDKKTDIADLGYGYSQVIPILLKIVVSAHLHETNKASIVDDAINESPSFTDHNDSLRPILNIEEPEANLHPNLQSKLADVFVLAYKTFGTHFILETHSEYFIRKLQYLTAKKEITQDDAVIYYFNADECVSEEEPKVKKIKVGQFGGLTDNFGPGFVDEATSLKFDLMKLNEAQNN